MPEPTLPKKGTQAAMVLDELLAAKGEWINGQYFIRGDNGRFPGFTQFHAVIFNLENRYGWPIEHSEEKDEWGFKSYRIVVPVMEV